MGYQIEFYALDLATVGTALAGGYPDLPAHLRSVRPVPGAPAFEAMVPALADLLGGELGRALAERGGAGEPMEADTLHAHAFSHLVAAIGLRTGEVVHNSAAGGRFRDRFIGRRLPELTGGLSFEALVDRPLLGFARSQYPGWGGLSRAELAGRHLPALGAIPELPDTDEDDWVRDIAEALAAVAAAGRDLVTLYR